MWDCFERYKAMKGTQGYCDDLRVFCRASHENRAKEVLGLWSIYDANDDASGKVLGGSSMKARTRREVCGSLFWGSPQDS